MPKTMKRIVILKVLVFFLTVKGEGDVKRDCKSFRTLAEKIETLVKSYKMTSSCKEFSNCTGVTCYGSGYGNSFNVSVGAEHCKDPIKLWMHLIIPNAGINEWRELMDLKRIDIFKDLRLVAEPINLVASAYVTPSMKRNGRDLTIGGIVCMSFKTFVLQPIQKCQNIPEIKFVITPNLCNGTDMFITPSTHKAISTSGTITERRHTDSGKTPRLITKGFTPKEEGIGTKKNIHNKQTTVVVNPNPKAHRSSHSSGSTGISVGTKVAIAASVILVAFLVLGLFAYWRKLKISRPACYDNVNIDANEDETPMESHVVL